MSQYVINGGKRLEGELQIAGSKNAALPIMAATLLNEGVTYLENCPRISDVEIMRDLLKELGCRAEWKDNVLVIDTGTLNAFKISEKLVKRMRSSIILLGALAGRCHEAMMSQPGGCQLGKRPIDLHLEALRKMGAQIYEENDSIYCKAENLQGVTIDLKFPSVGATENIILAAVKAKGVTIINNPAREPEIVDLADYLKKCGAEIKGAGSSQITIKGVQKLKSITYQIVPDRIIAGTYMTAAAITQGHIILNHVNPEHLEAVTGVLDQMGCSIQTKKNRLELTAPRVLKPVSLVTAPYPGFPTDMQSQMMALMCICDGKSSIEERLFESRFKTADELSKMGAVITVNNRRAEIMPCGRLHGATVQARDLRGGAALVIAGLSAEGCTIVEEIEHIKRGYADIAYDLRLLGAQIEERK